MVGKTPAAIARETLKLLSARQLAPTPENYHAVYLETAGLEADAVLLPTALAEQVVHLLESARPAFEEGDVRLHEMAEQLMHFLRQPAPDVATLQLLLENLAVLCLDDRWLHGQLERLQQVTEPPLRLEALQSAQIHLAEVIDQQTQAKARLAQAEQDLRTLMSTFIERLSSIGDHNETYHGQLEDCAQRLSRVSQLHELAPLLGEVMAATRSMTEHCDRARSELQILRARSESGYAEIDQLRQALEQTSALARQDAQTGVLNRRGLEEAVALELTRTRRSGQPMCVALLDLDDFKAINDRLGHDTGDRALVHLVDIARQVLRTQDQLGRYGGEEFVFLLPGTTLEQGAEIMKRLQRALTTQYFLQGSERILITFSAGVAQIGADEGYAHALVRADQAMYRAKRAGKNQVAMAPPGAP